MGEVLLGLVLREDRRVEGLVQCVVGEVLHDDGGLLLVDQARRFGDELLRVQPELTERIRSDGPEDRGDCAAGQLRLLGDLTQQVVLHLRSGRHLLRHSLRGGHRKPRTLRQVVGLQLVTLLARLDDVLHGRDVEVLVHVADSLADKLV